MIELPEQLEELRNKKIWLNYVMVWNPNKDDGQGGYNKPPVNPYSLKNGDSTDPAQWTTFDEAVKQVGKMATVTDRTGKKIVKEIHGVGLVLKPAGLVGVDFDHVMEINENGQSVVIDETAQELWTYLDSYREISPSGTGVHVLVKGKKPGKRCKVEIMRAVKNGSVKKVEYEIYDDGRYFTFTGRYSKKSKGLESRQEQLDKVYRYIEIQVEKQEKEKRAKQSFSVVSCSGGSGDKVKTDETDSELWEKMFRSKKGDTIKSLYDGKYSDHSVADSALLAHLAYWTNNDPERMDRMFRQSGLNRDKWEKRADYRSRSIKKALQGNTTYREYTQEEKRAYARMKEEEERQAMAAKYKKGGTK